MPVRTRLHIKGSGLHFVTTTVRDWIPVFADSGIAAITLNLLKEACGLYDASIVGYVLMPSHLHALVWTRDNLQLSQLMRSFKTLSSKRIKDSIPTDLLRRLTLSGRFSLWQPRFDELTIYSESQFKVKLEYIHNNPVKAGLVADAVVYPYSSAKAWLQDENGAIELDKLFKYQDG